jgi:uncharacterized protein
MLFTIMMLDKPDSAALREATGPAHRAYMMANAAGMRLGGPLFAADAETVTGSMAIKEFADRAAAEAFVAQEPYNQAGLFETLIIRPFKAVVDQPVVAET